MNLDRVDLEPIDLDEGHESESVAVYNVIPDDLRSALGLLELDDLDD